MHERLNAREPSRDEPERAPGQIPGDSGVWMFIIADMAMFAMFFLVFTQARFLTPELFDESSKRLDQNLGVLNTLILLTSSFFMVQAVHAAREGHREWTVRYLCLTIVVGLGFAVTKIIEYAGKIQHGVSVFTNDFFMYYFVFTGIHFVHFVMGIVALIVITAKARRDRLDKHFLVWIESAGCYWHMVDLLWIVLFPMLYLQRSA